MSEINRLYSYRELLTGRRAVPKAELLAKLEISQATFKRDLAKLRDQLNIPITFDQDLGGYRMVTDGQQTELPGLWFSQDEILALLTIQHMIAQLEPGLLGVKLKPLQKRLNDMLKGQGLDPEALAQRVRLVHAGKRRMELKAFEAVAKATLARSQLSIHHFSRQTGETTERVISPQQLVNYRDNWYVDAWCHLRKDVRSFAVDAITACTSLDLPAKDVDPDQLRLSMQASYGIFGGQPKAWARLRFTAQRARWVKNEQWHPDQRAVVKADGTYELEIPYSDERELIGDILRYGASVEVQGPADLRESVARAAADIQRIYAG